MQIALLFEVTPKPETESTSESYESLYRAGEFATVLDVRERSAAPRMANLPGAFRVRLCETERDYGMFDRREAPQYYPPFASRIAH